MGLDLFQSHGLDAFTQVVSTGDLTISASTITSAAAIDIKASGVTDKYLTISTVANIPTLTATGAAYLEINSKVLLPIEILLGFGVGVNLRETNTAIGDLQVRNAANDGFANLACSYLKPNSGISAQANALRINSQNVDGTYLFFAARDTGVGLVDIARLQGAADPYVQIGRDDTGVSINSVTDGLVLQMGAGTNNEAAGQGFGISVKLGNAASEVEERASLDFVLTVATNGSEQADLALRLMAGGAIETAFTFSDVGGIPTIYGTGGYVRIGDAAATGYSLASEDDLMVSGKLEVNGIAYFSQRLQLLDDKGLFLGTGLDVNLSYTSLDANAMYLSIDLPAGGASDVPVVAVLVNTAGNLPNLGLFDGATQPIVTPLEKAGKYSFDSGATSAGASPTMTDTNFFANSVVGDIVRVTAGTNATAGWYYITAVTDASNVDLDRNWCTGAVTGGTFVAYHSFTMLSAEGICTRITDGAPSDSSVEIDRDGWLILDVGQPNGRLYWRANNGWHYVDATA